jgi:hypothetical protein
MCRPSCCNNPGGQGTGIAAVAVIIGAALIAAKIRPIVAGIIHTVLEVIRLAAMATGLILAVAILTWAAIAITRWQLRRTALTANPVRLASFRPWERAGPVTGQGDCLACGGNGTVLMLTDGSRYQRQNCPVCEPARQAG